LPRVAACHLQHSIPLLQFDQFVLQLFNAHISQPIDFELQPFALKPKPARKLKT
jgi:hypothetical protein